MEQKFVLDYSSVKEVLEEFEKPIVKFSGGKDSIVLAHFLEPLKDYFTLVLVNTGANLPHMEDFFKSYKDRFNFVELKSNQAEYIQKAGYPSTLVPVYNQINSSFMVKGERKILINDWVTCCANLRGLPLKQYAQKIGSTLSIHGQRNSDIGGFPQYYLEDGVSHWGIIYDWTDADIFYYIKLHNLELPDQYNYAASHSDKYRNEDKSLSYDCWNCSASVSSIKVDYLRDKYPHLLEEYKPIVKAVYGAVNDELNRCMPPIHNLLSC